MEEKREGWRAGRAGKVEAREGRGGCDVLMVERRYINLIEEIEGSKRDKHSVLLSPD